MGPIHVAFVVALSYDIRDGVGWASPSPPVAGAADALRAWEWAAGGAIGYFDIDSAVGTGQDYRSLDKGGIWNRGGHTARLSWPTFLTVAGQYF
jgi:hypothetical protein